MDKYALLVEDDVEQIYFTTQVLEACGFRTLTFENYDDVVDAIAGVDRPVDLVVLDRRLPRATSDEPMDKTGDDLLNLLLEHLPDSPFVVFTGYTGLHHHQFATQERGVIDLGSGAFTLDRVRAFEKEQTIEFGEYVQRVADNIDSLGNIEVAGLRGDDHAASLSRRLLRRVAMHFGGVSITADALAGGLTDAPVWRCTIRSASGQSIAAIVVKQSFGSNVAPTAGIHTVLPASYVAAPVAIVSGMCDGRRAQIMQLAGERPTALLNQLIDGEADAASQLGIMAQVMNDCLSGSTMSRSIAEIASPLIDWGVLEGRLTSYGILPPRGSLHATTTLVPQHGDFHPGNLLTVGGRPVLIDFDSEVMASRTLDPVTALLSPLFHRESPMRGTDWPPLDSCTELLDQDFAYGSPCSAWITRAIEWVRETSTSERETWALILAYVTRQLKYDDVRSDERLQDTALAIATSYAQKLNAS